MPIVLCPLRKQGGKLSPVEAMPLIEYRCSQCARTFERLVSRAESASDADCPDCGQHSGKRLVSLFAPIRGEDGPSMASVSGGCCGAGGCACGR